MSLSQTALEQLLSNVSGQQISQLDLSHNDLSQMGDSDNHPLIKAIANNELKVNSLHLKGTKLNQNQLDLIAFMPFLLPGT